MQPAAADDDESAKLKLSSAGADPLGTTIGSSAASTSSCDCVPNVARIVRPHGTPPSRAFGVGGAPSADARKSTTRPFVDASRQRLCRLSSKSTSCGKACEPTVSSETLCLDFLPSAFFRRRPRPTVAQTDSSIARERGWTAPRTGGHASASRDDLVAITGFAADRSAPTSVNGAVPNLTRVWRA